MSVLSSLPVTPTFQEPAGTRYLSREGLFNSQADQPLSSELPGLLAGASHKLLLPKFL
jgi:hypothetical protein